LLGNLRTKIECRTAAESSRRYGDNADASSSAFRSTDWTLYQEKPTQSLPPSSCSPPTFRIGRKFPFGVYFQEMTGENEGVALDGKSAQNRDRGSRSRCDRMAGRFDATHQDGPSNCRFPTNGINFVADAFFVGRPATVFIFLWETVNAVGHNVSVTSEIPNGHRRQPTSAGGLDLGPVFGGLSAAELTSLHQPLVGIASPKARSRESIH
jgi:hypothetical protein